MKRGQVTIFILFAILIVFAILAVAFLYKENLSSLFSGDIDTRSELSACIDDVVYPSVKAHLAQGGVLNPQKTISYSGHNYTYLCHTANDYEACYFLHPSLRLIAKNSLEAQTKEGVIECFSSILEETRSKGYLVQEEMLNYSLDLVPSAVEVNIEKAITLTKGETSQIYTDFSVEVDSKLYELLDLASKIANAHANTCDFDYNTYAILYRNYQISRKTYQYSNIYTIKDKISNDEIKFAIRSCVYK